MIKINKRVNHRLVSFTLALLTIPTVTIAQENSRSNTLKTTEEVLVTARRRDESLANVPIAISAISADRLTDRQVKTDSDLQYAVPGLTIRQTQGNNSLTYSIRGQTADTFSGSPSAVVTYFNDVPLTVASSSSLFDLESVQVLKGPQGTLFGRNATGGAVLFNSAKPKNESEALLTVRAGNYNTQEFEGMMNVPLIDDTLLLRVAVNNTKKDGYINNILNGDTLGDIDRLSGRVSLAWEPNDRLANLTVAQHSTIRGTNTGASYPYSIYNTNCSVLNCNSSFLSAGVEQQKTLGLYKTQHPWEADHNGTDWIVTNTTTYELADNLTLKNIFGVSHAETDSEQPQLGLPFATIVTANIVTGESGNETNSDSISNEIQLQGLNFDGKLNWIVGLYWQDFETDTLWPQTYFEDPAAALTNSFRISNESRAIYAQGTYDLSAASGIEGLRVTAGARYTQEEVEIKQLPEGTYTFGAPDQNDTFEDPSWELGLEYQSSDELMTYLKTRGSFRSGGFNGAAPPVDGNATTGGNQFDSENVKDVEAGLKFRGNFLDRPASLNLAIYRQWIENVQRVEFPDPDGPSGPRASIAVTTNVPETIVQGIEVDASILSTDYLEFGIAAAYTDAEFEDGDINLFGQPYSYGPVGDTPKMSGSVYALIDFPIAVELGQLTLRTEIYVQDEQYFSNAADTIAPGTKLPSYELVNARLSWKDVLGSKFSAAIYAKNLTDEEYFVGGMTLAAALGHNAAAVGEPRTYGMELFYQF
ncbi:MAG: TonB-dependent receptor plug domain-containing protein [Spongiibacteraceae bacterium]|nr:TonB-dependent receptor plug domain-containing protein [Spongiibacteraceae bacterium]